MDKKKFVIIGLVSGLIFGILMSCWDLYNNQPFSIFKFIFHFMFFSIINGYLNYRAAKKEFDKHQNNS